MSLFKVFCMITYTVPIVPQYPTTVCDSSELMINSLATTIMEGVKAVQGAARQASTSGIGIFKDQ